jgi:hypothetical protein
MRVLKIRSLVIVVFLALASAGCGQLFTILDPGHVAVHTDPTGDAGFPPTFDVIELRTTRGGSELLVRIWTTPNPVLPFPGTNPSSTQFSGGIGFNTDLDPNTGGGFISPCGFGQGLERFVDLSARNSNGTYYVLDVATFGVTGTATVSQDGPRVTFTIPYSALGIYTGQTEANALIGVGSTQFVAKDCVPDAGQMLPTRLQPGRHPVIQ